MSKPLMVHIIQNDKFTNGYINFMMNNMTLYDHFFIVKKTDNVLIQNEKVHIISQYQELNCNKTISDFFVRAKKIIVSGVFGCLPYLIKLNSDVLEKTFLHFWGGDYYCFEKKEIKQSKHKIKALYKKHLLRKITQKVGGIINLIPYEYDDYCKILNVVPKSHYVAPMPGGFTNTISISVLSSHQMQQDNGVITMILGNSATETNNHIEVLHIVEHLKNKLKIVCPLSYGNSQYREKVISVGKDLYGDEFHPITQFVTIEEYNNLLSTCDIGVFAMRRQQALGNVYTLLQLGKKVFLNQDSPQYKYLSDLGIKIFDLKDLSLLSLDEIKSFDKASMINNRKIVSEVIRNSEEQIRKWDIVFSAQ